MEEKVVHMVLKVDLECHRCYKKVRKILCKYPQIRDQIYNEKQGTVMIRVVCSTPEKIMNKIRRKGDKSIESIAIKEPEEKNEEEKKKKKKKEEEPEKKKEEPKVVVQPDQGNWPPQWVSNNPSYEGRPSYQYRDYGTSVAPPSYVERPIRDSYGGGYGESDRLWGQYFGQSSDNQHQRN